MQFLFDLTNLGLITLEILTEFPIFKPAKHKKIYDPCDLHLGDHIMVERKSKSLNICYYHHGIVVNDFPYVRVIHPHKSSLDPEIYNSLTILEKITYEFNKDIFCETSLENFICNDGFNESYDIEIAEYGTINEVNHSYEYQKLNPNVIVQKARDLLNEHPKYNLLKFNCETFALWCSTGDFRLQGLQIEHFNNWYNMYKKIFPTIESIYQLFK